MRAAIIEGPDGAGKTTLAKRLAEKSGMPYVHMGPPHPFDPLAPAEENDLIWVYRQIIDRGGIVDRLALSERIYGPLLRGEDRIGPDGWREIQAHVASVGAIQVLCLPPPDVCLRAWRAEREQLFRVDAAFWETYARYAWQARRTACVVYDWTSPNAAEVEASILGRLE